MKFYCETQGRTPNMFKGPIDPKTGWPTVHRLLTVEAKSIDEARKHFEKKFPGDVAHVYAEP